MCATKMERAERECPLPVNLHLDNSPYNQWLNRMVNLYKEYVRINSYILGMKQKGDSDRPELLPTFPPRVLESIEERKRRRLAAREVRRRQAEERRREEERAQEEKKTSLSGSIHNPASARGRNAQHGQRSERGRGAGVHRGGWNRK